VFSVFGVFSVLGFAVAACIGLDFELSVFPCFGGFWVFFFAVWTFSHYNHMLCFCLSGLKTFYCLLGCLWFFGLETSTLVGLFLCFRSLGIFCL
jgi:hypothetical protein